LIVASDQLIEHFKRQLYLEISLVRKRWFQSVSFSFSALKCNFLWSVPDKRVNIETAYLKGFAS
jgi:hypothetical protein